MGLGSLAWRGLIARPLRTGLTVVGVALGVAVITATLIASQAADEAVAHSAAELLGRAELRVRAFNDGGFTPRTLQALRALPDMRAAAPVSERRLVVTTTPGPEEQVFNLLVIGLDPESEREVRDHSLVAGIFLSTDSPTDAVVNAGWASEHGLELGDELLLTGRLPETPPLRIVGVLDDVGFGALAQGGVMLIGRDTLDNAFSVPAPISYIDLDIDPGTLNEVQRTLDATMTEPFVVETVADAAERFGRAQSSFATIAFLFGLIALVVGSFLVANTLAMTVRERTRELGLLRAAGTTGRQVLGIFLRQGAAIGATGGGLGVLLGIGLAVGMIGFLSGSRAALVAGLPLNPVALLFAFALGVAVTMVGTAIPAWRAASLSPIEALRPVRQTNRTLGGRLRWLIALELVVVLVGLVAYPLNRGEAPIVPVLLSLALLLGGAIGAAAVIEPLGRVVGRPFEWLFGTEGILGRANLVRDRVRTGLTVGALMIALAAVIALGTVAESTRLTAEHWVASVLPGENAIRLGIGVDPEQLWPTFEATPGLKAASPIVEFPAVIREGDAQRELSLAGIDPSVFQDAGALLLTEGRRADAFQALREGGAVLVPEGVAKREGIGVGDQLSLALPGAAEQSFRVAGVIAYTLPARSPDGALLISLTDARDRFAATTASLWAMVPRPDVAPSVFAASVEETASFLAGQAVTARQLASELGRSLDRVIGLFDALALIAVAIAGLGIVNTLTVGVQERLREIAILRSHGMTVGQVQAMVVTEAAIMGALSGVLAVIVGLAVGWAMLGGSEFVVPWPFLAAVVLAGTGVAAVAGLYPARVAATMPIVRSLKHFE